MVRFKITVGIKYKDNRAWYNQPIDRIGPIRPYVRPSKGQSGVLQAIDHSVTWSMTAKPPGSFPSALRVATHSQLVMALDGVLFLSWGAVGVFYSPIQWGEQYFERSIHI